MSWAALGIFKCSSSDTDTEYKTFLEWNSNPEIADAAEKLYGTIDNLELYVGLQAEEAKPVMEGAGLCPGILCSMSTSAVAHRLIHPRLHY